MILAFDLRPHKAGAPLFAIVTLLSIIEAVNIGDKAREILAEERRNKTLALLFGTGISATEVLVGKLAAIFIAPLSRLLTIVPCLIVVTMMKAATIEVCVAVFVTVIVLLALDAGLNLFCSLVFEERTSASIAATALVLVMVGFFPAINALNTSFGLGGLDRFWLSMNPATAPWLLIEEPRTNSQLGYVYYSIAFSAVVAVVFFGASAFLLSRIWQDQVSGTTVPLFGRYLESLRARQKQAARDLLNSNAYEWLIQRDFRPALATWGIIAGIGLLWLGGLWHWRGAWLAPMNYWITLVVLGLVVRWMTQYLGARQIGSDRATGTLELLLTTPLSVGDIMGAQNSAILRYVRPLYIFLGCLHVLFFILGLLLYPIPPGAHTNYILISALVALFGPWFQFGGHWGAFWMSLNTGRPMFAITRNLFGGVNRFSFFWVFFLAYRAKRLPNSPTGSLGETIIVGTIVVGLLLWYIFYRFCWTTDWNRSEKLKNLAIRQMRLIAAHPLPDANDPRVNGWDPTKPLFEDPEEEMGDGVDPELRDERSRKRILEKT